MTQPRLSGSSLSKVRIKSFLTEQYLLSNMVFAGVILFIIGYSFVFSPESNNYPVVCIHEKLTGLPCASCGLSHSFSLIVRGRLAEANDWNIYGLRIFIFFVSQLLMRTFFSIYYLIDASNRRTLIIFDIIGSIILFLISFYPFIRQFFMGFY
jgi:hypothetical protein